MVPVAKTSTLEFVRKAKHPRLLRGGPTQSCFSDQTGLGWRPEVWPVDEQGC